MKNTTRLAAFAILAALAGALPRAAGAVVIRPNAASSPAGTVPNNVNYQGRLVDNGFPVTGFRLVTFSIYDQLTLGAPLQVIGPQQVSVNQGLFSTTIAISTQALAGPLQKFLEVKVGSQVLAPREPLNSVPYALVAKSLEENLAISTVSVGTQLISSGTLAVASIQALNGSTFFNILSNAHMSSSTLTLDGNAATSLTTVGNVGIGTANPGSKLNVSSGTVIVDGNAATSLVLDHSGSLPVLRFREAGVNKGTVKSVSGSVLIDGDTTFNRDVLLNTNSTGNVGIGAAIPGTRLDVDGTAQFGNPGSKSAFSSGGALTMANAAALTLSAAPITLSGSNGYITSASSINASAFFGDASGLTNVVRRTGDSMTGSLTMLSPSTITVGGTAFSVANTVFSVGGGRVGVGAVSPTTKLHMSSGTLTIDGNVSPSIVTTGSVGIQGAAGGFGLQVTGTENVTGTLSANTVQTTNPIGTQYGGTGQNWSAVVQGAVPFFNGAGTMTTLPPSGSGQVLTTQGAGANPIWTSPGISGAAGLTNDKIWIGSAGGLATEQSIGGDATMTNTGSVTVTKINGAALGTTTPTSGNILVGNAGSTQWASVAVSGNATLSSAGSLAITSLPAISGAALTSLTPGNISAGTAGISITGNAGTASALAADPADCSLPNLALGINASGVAQCGQPSNVTGNAATATIGTGINFNTSAAIKAITPASVGLIYLCTNCAPARIVVSTGTTAGSWADAMGNAF